MVERCLRGSFGRNEMMKWDTLNKKCSPLFIGSWHFHPLISRRVILPITHENSFFHPRFFLCKAHTNYFKFSQGLMCKKEWGGVGEGFFFFLLLPCLPFLFCMEIDSRYIGAPGKLELQARFSFVNPVFRFLSMLNATAQLRTLHTRVYCQLWVVTNPQERSRFLLCVVREIIAQPQCTKTYTWGWSLSR